MSQIYGDVSQDFIHLVKDLMGAAPAVFSFLQGHEQSATVWPPAVGTTASEVSEEESWDTWNCTLT